MNFSNKSMNDIERDFCDNMLEKCADRGLEIMRQDLPFELYKVWYDYALECVKEVSQKINNNSIVVSFQNASYRNYDYMFQKISDDLRELNSIRRIVFTFYSNKSMNELRNQTSLSTNRESNPFFSAYSNRYINPYLIPSQEDLRYVSPINLSSPYSIYYNNVNTVLSEPNYVNDSIALSLINATGQNHSKESLISLPIGVAKALSDASIEFLFSKLKEEYANNLSARLVLDGLKELTKEKMKNIIGQWYMNKRYY